MWRGTNEREWGKNTQQAGERKHEINSQPNDNDTSTTSEMKIWKKRQ